MPVIPATQDATQEDPSRGQTGVLGETLSQKKAGLGVTFTVRVLV